MPAIREVMAGLTVAPVTVGRFLGLEAPKVHVGQTRKVRDGFMELGWAIKHVRFGAIGDRPGTR